MNKVMLVGRLTRDPELRKLPSGKPVATFTIATNEYRGAGGERTEYHPCVAWDRLAEICGQFLTKGQLVDVEGRLQTRSWDDDAGKRHWRTEIVVASLEMLSGRAKKDYAREVQSVAAAPDGDAETAANGGANGQATTQPTADEPQEALVAM
jgi:single-strand DNA-binding protein